MVEEGQPPIVVTDSGQAFPVVSENPNQPTI
jgi:hypothetical protein